MITIKTAVFDYPTPPPFFNFLPFKPMRELYSAPWRKASVFNLDYLPQDAVVFSILDHLYNQKGRATSVYIDDEGERHEMCAYVQEKENGAIFKCSAGSLLPPYCGVEFSLKHTNAAWESVASLNGFSKKHYKVIEFMQVVHDCEEHWENETTFRWPAERYTDDHLRQYHNFTEQSIAVVKYLRGVYE